VVEHLPSIRKDLSLISDPQKKSCLKKCYDLYGKDQILLTKVLIVRRDSFITS
jgi:hypothetical protein